MTDLTPWRYAERAAGLFSGATGHHAWTISAARQDGYCLCEIGLEPLLEGDPWRWGEHVAQLLSQHTGLPVCLLKAENKTGYAITLRIGPLMPTPLMERTEAESA